MTAEDTWSLKKALRHPMGIAMFCGALFGFFVDDYLSKNQIAVGFLFVMGALLLYVTFRKEKS